MLSQLFCSVLCLHCLNLIYCHLCPAGLEGVDAFEKLKLEAAKATIAHPPKALKLPQPIIPDPAIAKAALEVTAREGLPVTGAYIDEIDIQTTRKFMVQPCASA